MLRMRSTPLPGTTVYPSCPVKTALFLTLSLSLFLTFSLSLELHSAPPPSPSLQALFLFFLWEYVESLFLTLSRSREPEDEIFSMAQKRLILYPKWCLWLGMEGSNLLKFHSRGLLTCLWRRYKSFIEIFWSIYCIVTVRPSFFSHRAE